MESDKAKRLFIKNRFRKLKLPAMETTELQFFNDLELVNKYKSTSDKVYVGELYKRYTHLVLGMCIYYFKDKDVARDVTIEIFEKLFTELKKREIENFKGWLTFVVRNYCISELRKMQTQLNRDIEYQRELKEQENGSASEESKEKEIEDVKQVEKLEKALNELNPFQKKCIELFYYKNMSYYQIVELTGYSVNEVKSYIQNGKRNLKLIIATIK